MSAQCTTALVVLITALSCTPRGVLESEPLIDDRHMPDIVTDGRIVNPPPTYQGHRYLHGWWPWRQKDKLLLVPDKEGAWIELANLTSRARKLILDLEILGQQGEFSVEIEFPGGAQSSVPLSNPLEIPLPADLLYGRTALKLTFPKEPDPVVVAAHLDSAVVPGEVAVSRDQISQGPQSLVDFVRRVESGDRLRGKLTPPEDANESQRFSIRLKRDGHDETTEFEWPQQGWRRLFPSLDFDIPLGLEGELVRIRLLAEGTGSSATWSDLKLVRKPQPAPELRQQTTVEIPPAPRLVVLYVLDALRDDFIDLSPPETSRTPNLSRLAREGVVFSKHQSIAPNTIPSTKSLFTGQIFLTQGHAKVPETGPRTLAEAFVEAGYRTAAFSGNGYVSETYGTSRGFEHLAEEVVFREYADTPDSYNDNAEQVQRAALKWIDGLEGDEKAFVYLHTIHPHNPYDPPEPIRQQYVGSNPSSFEATTANLLHVKHNRMEVDANDRERIEALYAGAVAYNDQQIGVFLEQLTKRYPQQEILLMVTSDHGEELFDHGGVLHGYTLYNEQLHIPLIVFWPGHLSAREIEAPTVNVDVHETLRQLIGIAPSGFDSGRSLWPWILGQDPPVPRHAVQFAAASSVKGGIFSAQSDRYKLILAPRVGVTFGMGEGLGRSRDSEYVFDLIRDPEEQHNIAGTQDLEVAWLRSLLTAWVERGKYLESDHEEPTVDEETQKQLRALGYLD